MNRQVWEVIEAELSDPISSVHFMTAVSVKTPPDNKSLLYIVPEMNLNYIIV